MSAPPGTPVTGSENPAATPLIGAEILAPFAHRVGQRHQIILVGMAWQWTSVANHLPAARGGDSAGVQHA